MVKGYKSLRIKNTEDLSSTIQKIANLVYNNEMDTTTARCLNELIKTRLQLAKVIELEEQVEILTQLLEKQEREHNVSE